MVTRVAQQLLLVVVLASLASALASCGQPSEPLNEGETTMDEDRAYVFVDGSDPRLDRTFILRGRSCFAQVSVAPYYRRKGEKREFYLCPLLTDFELEEARYWLKASGDIDLPFPPGANHFYRVLVNLGVGQSDEGTAFFDIDNAAIREWLYALRHVVMVEEYRIGVEEIPAWISESDILLKYLGFHDEYDPFPQK